VLQIKLCESANRSSPLGGLLALIVSEC